MEEESGHAEVGSKCRQIQFAHFRHQQFERKDLAARQPVHVVKRVLRRRQEGGQESRNVQEPRAIGRRAQQFRLPFLRGRSFSQVRGVRVRPKGLQFVHGVVQASRARHGQRILVRGLRVEPQVDGLPHAHIRSHDIRVLVRQPETRHAALEAPRTTIFSRSNRRRR